MAFVDIVLAVLSIIGWFTILNRTLAPVVVVAFTGYAFCSVLTVVRHTIIQLFASLTLK